MPLDFNKREPSTSNDTKFSWNNPSVLGIFTIITEEKNKNKNRTKNKQKFY